MRKNPLSNMSTQGGILTSEFLQNFRKGNVNNPRVLPESFVVFGGAAPANKRELDRQTSEAWDDLLERWDSISTRYLRMDVSEARTKWIIPLLKALGFDPVYNKQDIAIGESDELKFKLSHKGWDDLRAPMVHTVAPSQDLEERPLEAAGSSRGERRRSPHDELQAYLNLNKITKWGIVTNGILLRVLREFYHTTTKGYVEFDIENIFRERSFTDFKVVYRIAHASRFLQDSEGMCHLEHFYRESVAAGVAVGQNLRKNVKRAIEALGNGFLTQDLADRMTEDEELCKSYYSELLKVIYRMLFLLFAEQRAMLPTRDSLYAEEYSMNRLREIAETRKGKDEHYDLWEGLKVTFRMLKNGCPELKVFGYNGSLFDESEIRILSGLSCKNSDILTAVRHLTVVEEEGVLKRINYLDLGVEELGSIYESLLDFTPRVPSTEETIDEERIPARSFFLDPRGAARKTTGSYYTNPLLVDELIKSALKPVVEDRLVKASDKEKALLSIKVCDPACGSGAFLIAANNFMARELAKIRTGQAEPPDREVRKARRDVLQHCIYGVDLNPMAVELAKVSLWINSCVEDMPLNFLDHHIKVGNSLIGATPELLKRGIPDGAFAPIEGDNKDIANRLKKRNSLERKQKLIDEYDVGKEAQWAKELMALSNFLETTPADVEAKKGTYASIINSQDWQHRKSLADAWTASFFWPLGTDALPPPTQATLRMIHNGSNQLVDPGQLEMIRNLAQQYRFFHWYLEFPDVFKGEDRGFDCVLGNPPWETVEVKEIEFFERRFPAIAKIGSSARKREIENLKRLKPHLWDEFRAESRSFDATRKYLHESGRFLLTGRGRTNSYSVFAEHSHNIAARDGRVGIIVPTGIATDDTNKEFFRELAQRGRLVSLFDFENKEGIFPDVHRSYKFCLFTVQKRDTQAKAQFAFFLTSPDQLADLGRRFELGAQDLALLNPNTKTCPIFRSRRDAELTKEIYKRIPILVEERGENPWSIYFKQGLFNMATDSGFFKDATSLEEDGFVLEGNVFRKGETVYLPLYEGKMIWLFNHRAGSIEYKGSVVPGRHDVILSETSQLSDPSFVPLPRFWVDQKEVAARLPQQKSWLCGFRDITNASSERTSIFSLIPIAAVGHSMPLVFFEGISSRLVLAFLANVNSFVFDYVARQKLGGNNMTYFILKQLPVLPPSHYKEDLLSLVARNALELTYTAWDMKGLAIDLGYVDSSGQPKPPFKWDEERRLNLQCELDAIYFLLYGVSREDADYILETFPIVRRKDVERFGEYRTKNLILRYYDEYSTS